MGFVNKVIQINKDFDTIGQSHEFSMIVPLRGWQEITNIIQSVSGTNVNKYFELFYKRTMDGLNYDEIWQDISNFGLTYSLSLKNDFLIKFKIVRSGTDNTGMITFNSITLEGNDNQSYYDVFDLSDTIFEEISWENERWNKLWQNILNKLYEKGIVPKYIERKETDTPEIDDKDYIDFWKSICYLFSFIVELEKRKIDEQFNDRKLLSEYLKQLTFLHFSNISLTDLQYIETYMLDEMRQRGTHQILMEKGGSRYVDGELMRYVGYISTDEFLYEYLPRHFSGWNVNNTSPIFTGHTSFAHNQLNKTGLLRREIDDLGVFNIVGGVSVYNDNGLSVASLNGASSLSTKYMKCNSYIPYEFTFQVRFSAVNSNNLTVSVEVRKETTVLNLYSISPVVVQDKFIQNLGMKKTDMYYFVRCIIYAKQDIVTNLEPVLNIGQGFNLKFVDDETSDFKFTIRNTGGSAFYVYDVKCKPLRKYSTSTYLNSYNVMNLITVKRNGEVGDTEMSENIRRYLIPYGTIFQSKYIPKNLAEQDPFIDEEWNDGVTVEENGLNDVLKEISEVFESGLNENSVFSKTVFNGN